MPSSDCWRRPTAAVISCERSWFAVTLNVKFSVAAATQLNASSAPQNHKLYPTPKQALVLARMLAAHQKLYNAALEERISAWRNGQHSISYEDQTKSLTLVREQLPEDWAWMNCSSQQVTLRRLNFRA